MMEREEEQEMIATFPLSASTASTTSLSFDVSPTRRRRMSGLRAIRRTRSIGGNSSTNSNTNMDALTSSSGAEVEATQDEEEKIEEEY